VGHRGDAVTLDTVLAVWDRRKLLAVVVFAAILAGFVTIALALPGLYRSTVTVVVDRQETPGALPRSGIIGELEARLQTIGREILRSARLEALMDRFDLYPRKRSRGAVAATMEQLRRDIQVELQGVDPAIVRGMTIAFTVSFRGRDPQKVAQIANAVASLYVEENLKMRERQAADAAQALRLQVEEAKQQLNQQERRISEFKSRYLGQLPEQVATNLATLGGLNTQLGLNSSSQQMRALERRTTGTGEEAPTARLARLRQDLARLRKLYSDKYPDIVALKAEIAGIEAANAEVARPTDPNVAGTKRPLDDGDAELSALKAEERRLRRDIAAYQQRLDAAPQRELELQEMSRDYRTTKDLYETVLKRYHDAQVAQEMEHRRGAEEFQIVERALPALQPVAPKRLRLILVGVMLAVGAAGAAVVLAEHLDTSFHTFDDLRSFTTVPVLASIPLIVRAADTGRLARQRVVATVSITLGLALVVAASYELAHGNQSLVRLLSGGRS
jgi:polysaccharide biosynthesis transport protein